MVNPDVSVFLLLHNRLVLQENDLLVLQIIFSLSRSGTVSFNFEVTRLKQKLQNLLLLRVVLAVEVQIEGVRAEELLGGLVLVDGDFLVRMGRVERVEILVSAGFHLDGVLEAIICTSDDL